MEGKQATRVAIVGAGYIADTHLEILAKTRGLSVTAIVDPAVERAMQLARRYSVPHTFRSVDELLAAPQPLADAAHVLVPPDLHVQVAGTLLDAGLSVLVEKPLALAVRDIDDLEARANRKGVSLAVNHNNLFHPSYVALREHIERGNLGRLEHVFVCLHVPLRQLDAGDFRHWMFQNPRNIVFEQGPHPFSQLVGLLGNARSLACQRSGVRDLGNGRVFYDTWQIQAEFERGPSTVLLSFGKGFAESWIHVIGSDGAMRIDLLREHALLWDKTPWMDFVDQAKQSSRNARRALGSAVRNAWRYATSTAKLRERTDVFYVGMSGSLRDFHQALRDQREPLCAPAHARSVLQLCEAVTKGLDSERSRAAQPVAQRPAARRPVSSEVLVTGATGFLGRALVERLRAEAVEVRVLVRNPSQVPAEWLAQDVRVCQGSIEDADAVDRAVAGCRAVYHLATGAGASYAELERTMIAGCKNIADSCLRHRIPRLFFTSSIAALYLGGSGAPILENSPPDPKAECRSPYARAKAECERLLVNLHCLSGLPVVVFRPGVVVGRGGLVQHSGVGLWTRDSECLGWGRGRHPLPFVWSQDVVDALLRGLYAKDIEGHVFHLVGDAEISARQYVRALRRRTGRRFRFHPQWLWWMQTVEIAKWLVKKVIGRKDASWPAYRDLKSRSLRRKVDNSLAKRQLVGWMPIADRDLLLYNAIDWYAEQVAAQRRLAVESASVEPFAAAPSSLRSAEPVPPNR